MSKGRRESQQRQDVEVNAGKQRKKWREGWRGEKSQGIMKRIQLMQIPGKICSVQTGSILFWSSFWSYQLSEAHYVSGSVCVGITHRNLFSNLKLWYLSAPQRCGCSHIERKHNMACESALCWTVHHRYWQGGTLDVALRPCQYGLIVRPRIEEAEKEKW